MSYTEQDVERVAEAICNADTTSWKNTDDTQTLPDVTWAEMRDGTDHIPYEGISLGRDHYRGMARAALESMEREPLEHVLRDTRSWLQHLEVALQDDGQFACTVYGYEATVKGSPVMDATRYGADPAEAIHNAIAAAQEER